jgi:hypothetical protein
MTNLEAAVQRELPRIDNWYAVGAPSVSRRYDWEPGDMTRYEFLVTFGLRDDVIALLNIGGRGSAMVLPKYWTEADIDPGYVMAKMGLNEYNAARVAQFLGLLRAKLAQGDL